jgi:hypothetical protein
MEHIELFNFDPIRPPEKEVGEDAVKEVKVYKCL